MRKLLMTLSVLIGLSACQKNRTSFKPEALTETIQTTDGNETTFGAVLDKHKGELILIDVWASWCPDCIKGMPKLKKLQTDFPEMTYMFLSYDKTIESWKEGIAKYISLGENYRILSDWKGGKFKDAIDLDWIPRYILIDKAGNIAFYRAIEADDQKLISKIKALY
jgi:thiol-disulfide isomerase/thioredoxin